MNTFSIKNYCVFLTEGNHKILQNINISTKTGDIVQITGKNGVGKTTLLKSIMKHFSTTSTGDIILNNKKINNYTTDKIANAGIFYLTQQPTEIDSIKSSTLFDELEFEQKKVVELMKRIGLQKNVLEKGINTNISGGQKKKFEFLQLLLQQPKVLLIDEIDAGLDKVSLKQIVDYINKNKSKLITFFISHNDYFAKLLKPNKYIELK